MLLLYSVNVRQRKRKQKSGICQNFISQTKASNGKVFGHQTFVLNSIADNIDNYTLESALHVH